MSSSRLPGKVLKPLYDGRPMLDLMLERVRRCRLIDDLVVATSDEPSDDPVVSLCNALNVQCFRGSLDDVLDRFYRCAVGFRHQTIVRLTGDCPLSDSDTIDEVIRLYRPDYTSNTLHRTMPKGLDVEVFSLEILEKAWRLSYKPDEREHVTPAIKRLGKTHSFEQSWGFADTNLSVDTGNDFERVSGIFAALYPTATAFGAREITKHLRDA